MSLLGVPGCAEFATWGLLYWFIKPCLLKRSTDKVLKMIVHQWRSVPFRMRENDFTLNENGFIAACWITVINIPITQFNVTWIGLGYNMILSYPS